MGHDTDPKPYKSFVPGDQANSLESDDPNQFNFDENPLSNPLQIIEEAENSEDFSKLNQDAMD